MDCDIVYEKKWEQGEQWDSEKLGSFYNLQGIKWIKKIVCFYISEIEQECDIDVEQVKQSVKSTVQHYMKSTK